MSSTSPSFFLLPVIPLSLPFMGMSFRSDGRCCQPVDGARRVQPIFTNVPNTNGRLVHIAGREGIRYSRWQRKFSSQQQRHIPITSTRLLQLRADLGNVPMPPICQQGSRIQPLRREVVSEFRPVQQLIQ